MRTPGGTPRRAACLRAGGSAPPGLTADPAPCAGSDPPSRGPVAIAPFAGDRLAKSAPIHGRANEGAGAHSTATTKKEEAAMRVYYDRDADLNLIKGKKVAIVGYGSQGHAHALNLRDSRRQGRRRRAAQGLGHRQEGRGRRLKVMTVAEAAKWADVMMMLTPDELQADIYREQLARNMKHGAALLFAHGLNVHFNLIEPRTDLDVLHGRAEGPRPHGARRIPEGRRRAVPDRRPPGRLAATRTTSACPTPRPSAAAARASSRPTSRKSARPICSASRSCSAAASSS